jgi:hypothetical protein
MIEVFWMKFNDSLDGIKEWVAYIRIDGDTNILFMGNDRTKFFERYNAIKFKKNKSKTKE